MKSWKTTQYQHFSGSSAVLCAYFKIDKFFVTYKRWDVWYEMKFDLVLN